MSTFVIIALLLTLALIIYYGVLIAIDVRKMGKKTASNKEEFDVSSMQEQDDSFSVDESQFKLPDSDVKETVHEPQNDIQDQEEFLGAVQQTIDKPVYKPRPVLVAEEKMETTEVITSQEKDVDDFYATVKQGQWIGGKFPQPDKTKVNKI